MIGTLLFARATIAWAQARAGNSGGDHLVADAVDRLDPLRVVRVVFDLGAQPADMSVDAAQVDRLVLAPHQAQDVVPAQHLPGPLGQRVEEVEIEAGELDRLAAP